MAGDGAVTVSLPGSTTLPAESSTHTVKDQMEQRSGEVAGSSHIADVSQKVKQQTFIPFELAAAKIAKASQEMKAMKAKHVEAIREMEVRYRDVEQNLQSYYLRYIEKLNESFKKREQEFSDHMQTLADDSLKYRSAAENTIQSLQGSRGELEKMIDDLKLAVVQERKRAEEIEARGEAVTEKLNKTVVSVASLTAERDHAVILLQKEKELFEASTLEQKNFTHALQSQVDQSSQAAEASIKKVAQANERITELQKLVEDKNTEIQSLQGSSSEQNERLQSQLKQAEAAEDARQKLQIELSNASDQLIVLKNSLSASTSNVHAMSNDSQAFAAALQQLLSPVLLSDWQTAVSGFHEGDDGPVSKVFRPDVTPENVAELVSGAVALNAHSSDPAQNTASNADIPDITDTKTAEMVQAKQMESMNTVKLGICMLCALALRVSKQAASSVPKTTGTPEDGNAAVSHKIAVVQDAVMPDAPDWQNDGMDPADVLSSLAGNWATAWEAVKEQHQSAIASLASQLPGDSSDEEEEEDADNEESSQPDTAESAPQEENSKQSTISMLEDAVEMAKTANEQAKQELEAAAERVSSLEEELDANKKQAMETEQNLREEISELERKLTELEAGKAEEIAKAATAERVAAEERLDTVLDEKSRLETDLQSALASKERVEKRMKSLKDSGQPGADTSEIEAADEHIAELQARLKSQDAKLEETHALVSRMQEAEDKLREQERIAVQAAEEAERTRTSQLDALRKEYEDKMRAQEEEHASRQREMEASQEALEQRVKTLTAKTDKLQTNVQTKSAAIAAKKSSKVSANARYMESATSGSGSANAGKTSFADQKKMKELEKQVKMSQAKVDKLERKLKEEQDKVKVLEKSGSSKGGGSSSSGGGASAKEVKMLEKKVADTEKKLNREIDLLKNKEKKANDALTKSKAEVEQLTKDLKSTKSDLEAAQKELETLRKAAGEGAQAMVEKERLDGELKELKKEHTQLEQNYKKEMTLRKRYYNMIEDMKGKIRVYCRVRPFNTMEKEKGSKAAAAYPDDVTINVKTTRDTKTFTFDNVFPPGTAQETVFEDTKHLMQSAIDGYNVCIFAYGQTGAGKTFTMYGSDELPGIAPRAMEEMYNLIEENKGTMEVNIKCYMVELYNDGLIDLLKDKKEKEKELTIAQDAKGIVFVKNCTVRTASDLEELKKWNKVGDSQRHVASTAMNATSSRSHLVFSILIEAKIKATGNMSVGKLTLVDLAGSERAGKTGATGERLKEGQAINQSLSALGNVINALSTGEKHVPYRSNKLTRLLQDGLGGNAKTLMFVNVSPSEYNAEETVNSLQYAARVKLITNDAAKAVESEEIQRLKDEIKKRDAAISKLKSGESVEDFD